MSKDWNRRTQLVHEGSRRSQYGEMAEAIFLTQGFVYETAEAAEARFIQAGADEFIYARYGNPTTRMFEERIAAIEGTEDAFATASGMAAVNGALTSMLRAGDRVVSSRALFGSLSLHPGGGAAALRRGGGLRRWHRPGPVAGGGDAGDQGRVLRVDVEPDAGGDRHCRRLRDRAPGGGAGDRGQRPSPRRFSAGRWSRGGRGGLFHHQAYRRAGSRPGRGGLRHDAVSCARCSSPT